MTEPLEPITVEMMEAAATIGIAQLRSKGLPLPYSKEIEAAFKLGFADGAEWCVSRVCERLT